MVIKYATIFQCKTLQNLPKLGFFGLKTNHLATLLWRSFLRHFMPLHALAIEINCK
jgi:hypothetical protein